MSNETMIMNQKENWDQTNYYLLAKYSVANALRNLIAFPSNLSYVSIKLMKILWELRKEINSE